MTILTSGTKARSDDKVIFLDEKTPAPFAGYLFPPAKEKEVRLKLIEGDFNAERVDLSQKIILASRQELGMANDRLENFREQNNKLSKDLIDSRNASFWQYTLFFMAGAFITGAISYGVVKSINP
jgi:hypothetical protein